MSSSNAGQEHPRDYIQKHKRELEIWDNASWKQALNAFDALKDAWTARGAQIAAQLRQAGYYMSQQESAYLQRVSISLDARLKFMLTPNEVAERSRKQHR